MGWSDNVFGMGGWAGISFVVVGIANTASLPPE